MPKAHAPRRGSMQFWPRKRAKKTLPRIRSWQNSKKIQPLGFIGYKVGMTHVMAVENRSKAPTKGETISLPTTIIECPPLFVFGVSFYKNSKKITQILSSKTPKELKRKIAVPKKDIKKIEEIKEFDDLRLLVHTQPKKTTIGTKKPKIMELVLGGSKEEKLEYAKQKLGQEILVKEVFEEGTSVDIHGITKGKGFQGTVKRFGVMIRSHKSEKVKRGIGNLGAWTPKRVDYRVPQPGKMGYHNRTEYNKQIIKISETPEEINPKRGFHKYGLAKNNYLLVKGSIPGSKKSTLIFTQSIRPNKKMTKEAPEIKTITK